MIYLETDGVGRYNIEIDDVPDMLRGLGELLFMAQDSSISMEDRTLHLIDYLCESIAHDVEADLKRREVKK